MIKVNLNLLTNEKKDILIKFLLENTCTTSDGVYTKWLEGTNLLQNSSFTKEEKDFIYSFMCANEKD